MALFSFSVPRDLSFQNPVALAEYFHLQRIEAPSHKMLVKSWMYLFLIGAGFLFVVYLTFQAAMRPSHVYPNFVMIGVILDMAIGLVLHFRLMIRTLSFASDTVIREKKAGTWEALLLTNISAKQLVLGKWWAVLYITSKAYLLLGLLRIVIAISMGVVLLASDANIVFLFRNTPSSTPVLNIIAAIIIILLMTMLNGCLTAAAGVAASFLGRIQSPSLVTAQAARMTVIILPVALLLIPVFYVIIQLKPPVEAREIGLWAEIVMWIQITLLDNGTLLTGMLANPLDTGIHVFLPAALIVLAVYALLTFSLLSVGRFIAHKQGASA